MISKIFACCYIPQFPAQALLRLRPHLQSVPVAVLEEHTSTQRICSYNQPASLLGVNQEISHTQARILGPIRFLTRSAIEEKAAHDALLECFSLYSPLIHSELRGTACIATIDISGTERLLGPAALLIQRILQQMDALSVQGSVVVSRNIDAAICMARFGRSLVIEHTKEKAALSSLPIHVLEPSESQVETLAEWGVSTLDELAQLPATSLIARLGQQGQHLHERANGRYQNHFTAQEVSPHYRELQLLDDPLVSLDTMFSVADVLLDHLLKRVMYRASAIECLHLQIGCEKGTQAVTVTPAVPSEHKDSLLKLLQLRVEANPPQSPVQWLELSATPAKPKRSALGLFSTEIADASRLDITLARVRAIVGQDRAGSPRRSNTYCPDRFHIEPFPVSGSPHQESRMRAAYRQLRPQETVYVGMDESMPRTLILRRKRYQVQRAYGPWELTGEWWSSSCWSHVQWDVIASSGDEKIACRLIQDQYSLCWKLDGLYD